MPRSMQALIGEDWKREKVKHSTSFQRMREAKQCYCLDLYFSHTLYHNEGQLRTVPTTLCSIITHKIVQYY